MTTTSTTAELASLMRVSVMRLARRLRVERPDTGLTLTQIATLATIERHGPVSARDIADHEKVQPPSMTRVLAVLESRGLISRTPHPRDGRQQLVELTAEGRGLLRADRRQREAWLAQRLAELSPDDRDLLRAAAPIIERITRT